MRKCIIIIIAVMSGLVFALSSPAVAANTATQTVTFEVQEINEFSVSGNPAALVISTATAGAEPDNATDSSTTYALTVNDNAGTPVTNKITAAINSNMPANVTLSVNLTAPTSSGTSAGSTSLSTAAANAVTGIGTEAQSGIAIAYTLAATVGAGVLASDTRTVTFTLTDD